MDFRRTTKPQLMHGTKLLQLVKTLSKKELKAFTKHLKANYASSASLVELFEHISSFYGNWNNSQLKLKEVTTKFGQGQNKKVISNKCSEIYRILLKYLLEREGEKEIYHFEKDIMTTKILGDRKLYSLKEQKLNLVRKQLKSKALEDSWLPLKKIRLNELQYYSEEYNKYSLESNILEDSLKQLEQFRISLTLKYACELLWRAIILKTEINLKFFNPVLDLQIDSSNYFQRIYYTFFKALLHSDTDAYKETINQLIAKEKKEAQEEKLPQVDRQIILIYLINFAARQARRNKQPYGNDLLNLYRFGLQENLLIQGDKISRIRFTNIIDVACKFDDISFAKDFIQTYESLLPKDIYDDTIYLANVIILFAEKNYNDVVKLLAHKNFKNIDEKFRAQSFLLCSLYELEGNNEKTWERCRAFRSFLDRNKIIAKNFIKSYRIFVNTLEKLLAEELPKEKISNYIEEADNIVLRFWLLEKLKNYAQKYK